MKNQSKVKVLMESQLHFDEVLATFRQTTDKE